MQISNALPSMHEVTDCSFVVYNGPLHNKNIICVKYIMMTNLLPLQWTHTLLFGRQDQANDPYNDHTRSC